MEETSLEVLKEEREQLHEELLSTFKTKYQLKLLGELIETEIEIEKRCNQ